LQVLIEDSSPKGGNMMFPGWEHVSPRLGLFVAQLGSKSSIVSLRLHS